MAWNNPPIPWSEFERRLSGGRLPALPPEGDRDGAAWSRRRQPYRPPSDLGRRRDHAIESRHGHHAVPPYAELHCHSNFSFLDGASHPEELAEEAARLGLSALALTDHDGFYGVVRFAEAARAVGLPTVFGAELTLDLTRPQNGVADPDGSHLLVLARDPEGYARLSRTLARAQMEGKEKGRPLTKLPDLFDAHDGHWLVLTGCRKGPVPAALAAGGPDAARTALRELMDGFGPENVAVELWDHGHPLDGERNDALAALGSSTNLTSVATNAVHYATPDRRPLATAMAAVRARRSLDELDGWLPAGATAHLRSPEEQHRRFGARYPGAVERTDAIARECAFDLKLVAPALPRCQPEPGFDDEMSWLRELTRRGALRRYGPPENERRPGAYTQIAHELDLIESLGYPGYFLIVHDIVEFCRTNDIYCQGRGSAANSAVCYALGITKADPIELNLLFERFLSPERDGPPDIDLDIENGRREEAIQFVYSKYGRENAAQVANVITYRPRSAVRDMGRALGFPPGQLDAWSKLIDVWWLKDMNDGRDHDVPEQVLSLARELESFPRHLGIHSGGMVLCDRPVVDVCPVEWGRMENRSVLQWDKDDCAAAGLVKFDLLGLGMLTALHLCVDLIRSAHGVEIDLAELGQEDEVYEMLSAADTVGVFQVESRAQMATLPRLRPREFYDIVVEVALIRPGPIQGGAVHPYIRRRNGREPVTYLHPLLEKSLEKTLGVPLFQEQLMQMAIDVAGFTPAESDQLRQAMSSKRSAERMEALKGRLFEGMARNGILGRVAEEIYEKLAAFANFGFPESHAASFAYLVYASAWLKLHYPAAFCASLLNAQPMGFWSPNTLVADARRHGVEIRGVDVNASAADATLEPSEGSAGGAAIRLGISSVRDVGEDLAKAIANGRPYASLEEVVRRAGAGRAAMEALATAGAFGCFGLDRRRALWAAGAAAEGRADRLPGTVVGVDAPTLPGMSRMDEVAADLWAMGISPDDHPIRFVREWLDEIGAVRIDRLAEMPNGVMVAVGGTVTHRQMPATAQGTVFINLEDEGGLLNVICSKGVWTRYRRVARLSPALLIRGKLEHYEGVISLVAARIEPLSLRTGAARSRDFR
jgi:error-prone DNA polymerase